MSRLKYTGFFYGCLKILVVIILIIFVIFSRVDRYISMNIKNNTKDNIKAWQEIEAINAFYLKLGLWLAFIQITAFIIYIALQ